MDYEVAFKNQREVALRLASRLRELREAARAVIAMECEMVNEDGFEPYDPIANPGQFDERIVALARAIEGETLSAWQPIETAPKDGKLILIRERSGRVQVAKWSCPDGYHSGWYVQLSQSGTADYPTWDVIQWAQIPE